MAAFGIPGGWELWAILAVVLLLFGPTQLPKLAKMFGKSAKALKEGMNEGLSELDDADAAPKRAEKPETPADE